MIWNKYTIETTNEAVDIVTSVLYDNGIEGAEIDDSLNISDEDLKKMYVDIPAKKVNDGKAKVSFYFQNENFDLEKIKNELNEYKSFIDMGSLIFTKSVTDDNDIFTKWRENFKTIEFDNVRIIPSWEKENTVCDKFLNIFIEPASAFGTGQHFTTRLCVSSIKYLIDNKKIDIKNSAMLDVGCGSGILSIVGAKLGIKDVFAIDIDENVKENLLDNLKLNELIDSNNFIYEFGDIIKDSKLQNEVAKKSYDIIVANILAPVIISLVNDGNIYKYIKDSGYFICSGILKEKEVVVRIALENSKMLKIIDTKYDDDWVCITCQKVNN